jgi:hypothetical protein
MKRKKQIIHRITSASERSRKYKSMLVTEVNTDISLNELSISSQQQYDVELLANQVKEYSLQFLNDRKIPYSELPKGIDGVVPPEWISQFDHIAGVRVAFGILFELTCFEIKRKENPDAAFAHLLRIIPRQQMLTIARMEARYFAGQARSGDGGKTSEREMRKRKLLSEYFKLRKQNDSPIHCRQIAAKRIEVTLTTAKRYFTIDELEKLYQQFT